MYYMQCSIGVLLKLRPIVSVSFEFPFLCAYVMAVSSDKRVSKAYTACVHDIANVRRTFAII